MATKKKTTRIKAEVIQAYKDKNTGKINYAGGVVHLSAARFKELGSKGFVKAADTPKGDTSPGTKDE